MTRSLQHALDETLGFIEQALEHIRAGESSKLELQNLRAYLLDILAAIERNPGVEAACDVINHEAVREHDDAAVAALGEIPDGGLERSEVHDRRGAHLHAMHGPETFGITREREGAGVLRGDEQQHTGKPGIDLLQSFDPLPREREL